MDNQTTDETEDERLADYENWCMDLVSSKSLEKGLQSLFESKPGNWVTLSHLFRDAGKREEQIPENLVATWLPSPHPNTPETLIHFVDNESNWTMTALNSQRKKLLDGAFVQQKKTTIGLPEHFANHKSRILKKYRSYDSTFKNMRPRQAA